MESGARIAPPHELPSSVRALVAAGKSLGSGGHFSPPSPSLPPPPTNLTSYLYLAQLCSNKKQQAKEALTTNSTHSLRLVLKTRRMSSRSTLAESPPTPCVPTQPACRGSLCAGTHGT